MVRIRKPISRRLMGRRKMGLIKACTSSRFYDGERDTFMSYRAFPPPDQQPNPFVCQKLMNYLTRFGGGPIEHRN